MALNLDHWRSLLKSVMDCWVPYKLVNTLIVDLWGADDVLHAAEAALVRPAADRTPAALTEQVVMVAVGRSVRQATAAPSILKHNGRAH